MNAIFAPMDLATRILIVDDDAGLRSLISSFLEKHGFQVDAAASPAEMRLKLEGAAFDLVVLDVMMPGEDGLTALRRLQKEDGPPTIMLSAVGTDVDRIVGLEMGAEDYLAKPCNPRELLARIRTVLRRAEQPASDAAPRRKDPSLSFSGWHMDPTTRTLVNADGEAVTLSDGEFRLLLALVEHPRRVLTRDQLLDYARGPDSDTYDRAIDVQISRLRRKLTGGNGQADLIRTVRNEGYMFTSAVSKH